MIDKSKLYTILQEPKDFFPYFEKTIYFEDQRSSAMPSISVSEGTVIGIRLDAVLIRVNNNITYWLPLNNSKVEIFAE